MGKAENKTDGKEQRAMKQEQDREFLSPGYFFTLNYGVF